LSKSKGNFELLLVRYNKKVMTCFCALRVELMYRNMMMIIWTRS